MSKPKEDLRFWQKVSIIKDHQVSSWEYPSWQLINRAHNYPGLLQSLGDQIRENFLFQTVVLWQVHELIPDYFNEVNKRAAVQFSGLVEE
jgi:hypothetical protein